jgi:hypothetical protein
MNAQKQKTEKARKKIIDSKRMAINLAKDRFEKREGDFLKAMDEVVKQSSDTETELTRISETHHMICHGRELLVQIDEAARLIQLRRLYAALPEPLRQLVDYGRKVGYRIHE